MSICANCGKEYVRKNRERYCSTECRGAGQSKKVTCKCIVCGKSFKIPPARAKLGIAKYCSTDCKYAHFGLAMRKRIIKTCPVCTQDFETTPSQDTTYCSYTCMGIARERQTVRTCATCGDPFNAKASVQAVYCSWECRVERLRGENHPSWKGGELPNYAGDWTRAKRKARERDNNICQECGKTPEENGQNMSVHHIKPYRAFDDPHEANRLENLISLCVSCHSKKPE